MSLYFMRHGDDLSSTPGKVTTEDVGLSKHGKSQAIACATKMASELTDTKRLHIIASPRKRTLEAAYLVAGTLGLDRDHIEIDARLAERDMHVFAGEAFSDVFSLQEPELIERGMEPYVSVYTRTKALFDEVLARRAADPTLLVGHSGSLRPLLEIAHEGFSDIDSKAEMPAPDSFIVIR